MPFYRSFCVTLLLVLCLGCRKPAGTGWDVDVVVPLLNSSLNIGNFIGDTLLAGDTTGLLHLRYNRRVASLALDSVVTLPDEVFTKTFTPPFSGTLQPGQQFNNIPPTELEFDIDGGIEITFADIKQGSVTVEFSNQISEPLDLTYKIPSATLNGKAFEINEVVPPGNKTLVKSYDMAGYRLNMRGQYGNKYNTIVQSYTVGLNAGANAVAVGTDKGAIIHVKYSHILPQYIEGYFGQETFDITADTLTFGASRTFSVDNFMLSDAYMEFGLINEFGADFLASFSGISSINTKNQTTVPLISSSLARIPINWPEQKLWNGVKGSTTTLVFNSSNSNITEFVSNLPDRISYQGQVSINPKPQGDAVGHSNYAFYQSGIYVDLNLDIPMRFSADRFKLQTTAGTDFSNISQLDYVRGGNFVISVTNGYPFDAVLQVYMMDENGALIDSLFMPGSNTMHKGQIDADNKVIAPTRSELLVPATQQKAANLKKTKSMRMIATFLLPSSPPDVPIYDNYTFDIKVRAELLYNVGIRAN